MHDKWHQVLIVVSYTLSKDITKKYTEKTSSLTLKQQFASKKIYIHFHRLFLDAFHDKDKDGKTLLADQQACSSAFRQPVTIPYEMVTGKSHK